MLLFFLLAVRHAGPLPPALRRAPRRRPGLSHGHARTAILLTVITAGTPLAARRPGRARRRERRRAQPRRRRHDAGRAPSPASPSPHVDRQPHGSASSPPRWPARRSALIFGVLALWLLRQPGRDRPGADPLRHRPLGASSARRFVGTPLAAPACAATCPASPTFRSSARCCSARTRWSTSRSLLTAGVAWFLYRTRAGLVLRAVGEIAEVGARARLSGAPHPLPRRAVRRRAVRASAAPTSRSPTRRCGSRA